MYQLRPVRGFLPPLWPRNRPLGDSLPAYMPLETPVGLVANQTCPTLPRRAGILVRSNHVVLLPNPTAIYPHQRTAICLQIACPTSTTFCQTAIQLLFSVAHFGASHSS